MLSFKFLIVALIFLKATANPTNLQENDEIAAGSSDAASDLKNLEAADEPAVTELAPPEAASVIDTDKDGIPDDKDTDDDNDGIPDDKDTDDDGDGIPDEEEVDEKTEPAIVETMEDKDEGDDTDESDDGDDEGSLFSSSQSEEGDGKKLIVILIDGVRSDYIERDAKRLKSFKRMSELGTHAKYSKPVFPANPVPNWYSIATGKYPSKHHLVNDYMFDSKKRHVFDKDGYAVADADDGDHEEKQKHWWNKAEPIWITAKRQRKRVHVSWWMGCDVVIRKTLPNSCDPYTDIVDDDNYDEFVADKLKEIATNMSRGDIDLAMIYYEAVGEAGRKYGPDSRKTKAAMRDVDKVIGDLFIDLDQKGIAEEVNVMIMSDTGIAHASKVINLEHYIDMNDVDKLVGEGAFVMIKAESGKNEHMYSNIRNANIRGLNVYRRQNLPFRYRIKESDMILPIVLTADEGYDLEAPKIKNKVVPEVDDDDEGLGLSGYDPDHVTEMRGIFYAVGPDFRAAFHADPVKNVDYYNLMCKILKIRAKDNDGDMDRVDKLLTGHVETGEDDEEEKDDKDEEAEADSRVGSRATQVVPFFSLSFIVSVILNCAP